MVYEGSNGSVKIVSGGTLDSPTGSPVAIAEVRSWTVDFTRDVVESTAMGDGHRKFLKGLQTWTGSMEIVYTDSENAAVDTALNTDTDTGVTVELYADANNTSTSKIAGTIIVTSFSVTNTYDGLMTASVSFQGYGSPTLTNWNF